MDSQVKITPKRIITPVLILLAKRTFHIAKNHFYNISISNRVKFAQLSVKNTEAYFANLYVNSLNLTSVTLRL